MTQMTHAGNPGTSNTTKFDKALDDFRKAVAKKDVDGICSAFLAMRLAGNGMSLKEFCAKVDKLIGASCMDIIIAGFSRRKCFMCEGGFRRCETCEGTGVSEMTGKCPSCSGLSEVGCDFCRGTDWCEREMIPLEIQQAVTERQYTRLKKDIKQVNELLRQLDTKKLMSLPKASHKELLHTFMRLQARITDLIESQALSGEGEQLRKFNEWIGRVLSLLKK